MGAFSLIVVTNLLNRADDECKSENIPLTFCFQLIFGFLVRMRKQTKFIHWNEEGWKAGICSVPPVGLPYSLMNLSNNLCIRHTFVNLENRFMKLYRRKANLHHYTRVDNMTAEVISEAAESLR